MKTDELLKKIAEVVGDGVLISVQADSGKRRLTGGDYAPDPLCRNCETANVYELRAKVDYTRPPKQGAGDKAKPARFTAELVTGYQCRNCDAEAADKNGILADFVRI